MPLDFPNNPTSGQRYTDSNITWQYDGEKWNILISGGPTYETTLPSGAADGREIYYAADATNSIIWHLRYRSAARSGVGAWELLGGNGIRNQVGASESTTSGTLTNLATPGPSVVIPAAGLYRCDVTAALKAPYDGSFAELGLTVNSGTTSFIDMVTQNGQFDPSATSTTVTVAAGDTIWLKYKTFDQTSTFRNRILTVTPYQVWLS